MPRDRAPSRVGMRRLEGRVLLDCMVSVSFHGMGRTGRGRVVWAGKDRPRAVSGRESERARSDDRDDAREPGGRPGA